ncbi:alpha/beta hydrolase [Methyloceanibacter superfactus]|jgi:pimeloyl-ACP methyl ester carboxylesterase|uniref:Alpha/beta hydrolase n=1 Tax=Methyloceanibacter superfactus TaxID=1774969 RepID=A0A1E3VND1_9HYPH|nr:alpha/beta hydrolase [Methyloceanibacter superfactus]ODR94811.1 alpha/beta hydrolase [Methyloceanibacter superfactus]
MQSFDSDGVRIAYVDEGEGEPILLIHGFASNIAANWIDPGWVKTLTQAGRRVIAYDNRGHGRSDKLYDPALYGAPAMAEDARRLLDHLGVARTDVLGYSMGARIAAFLTFAHPERVRSVIFGGLGIHMVRGMVGSGPLAHALEAPRVEDVTNATARSFRVFAEQTKSDLKALAACMRGPREKVPAERLGEIAVPALVAVGSKDVIGGSGAALAELIPGAQFLEITGRDHMRAVGDAAFKQGVLDFLTSRA